MILTQMSGSLKNHFILFISFIFIGNFSLGQMNLFYEADSILKVNGYFAALENLRKEYKEIDLDSDEISKSLANQAMMTYHSFVGNVDSSLYYEQKAHDTYHYAPINDKASFDHLSAKKFIVENYGNSRVLLFNEGHNRTHTRKFLIKILSDLKKLGFTTLALEDLRESNETIEERGFPVLNSGFYIKEPFFAELLREAIRLDIKLLPYEQKGAKDRGLASGKYLAEYLEDNPDERLVVMGGYGFLYKKNKRSSIPSVAEVLFNHYGEKIISLDCISFVELFDRKKESELYQYTVDTIGVKVPSVLKVNDQLVYPYFVDSSMVDAAILFPRTETTGTSFNSNLLLEEIKLKTDKSIRYVQVFDKKEYSKYSSQAIPILQFEVTNNDSSKSYGCLKKGKYTAVIHYDNEKIVRVFRLKRKIAS